MERSPSPSQFSSASREASPLSALSAPLQFDRPAHPEPRPDATAAEHEALNAARIRQREIESQTLLIPTPPPAPALAPPPGQTDPAPRAARIGIAFGVLGSAFGIMSFLIAMPVSAQVSILSCAAAMAVASVVLWTYRKVNPITQDVPDIRVHNAGASRGAR